MVYNLSDPNDAMDFWIKTCTGVYNKHAPFKTKRVRQKTKPKWLSAELQKPIHLLDLLESKATRRNLKLRNRINALKRAAKKKYFQDLLSSKTNSVSLVSN